MPTYLPWLDLLRFLSCVLVIVSHLDPNRGVGHLGHTGVGLFFSISGFLIGSVLLNGRGKPAWLATFYANRFLRIYPPLLMALVFVGLFFWVFGESEEWHGFRDNLVHYLTFTVHLSPTYGKPYGITWTLSVEEYFYLLLPLILWALRPMGTAIFLILLIGLTCLPGIDERIGTWRFAEYGPGVWFLIPVNLLTGAVVAMFRPRQRDGWPWVGVIGLLGVLINGWAMYFPAFGPVMGLLTTAVIWSFATTKLDVPGSLQMPTKAGKWSYGIYLFHLPFCIAALMLCRSLGLERFGTGANFIIAALVATAGATGMAALMYTLAEKPILSRRKWVVARPWARNLAMIAQVSLVPLGVLYWVLRYRF